MSLGYAYIIRWRDLRRSITSRQTLYYIRDNFIPHAVLPYCLLRGISGILCRTLSQWLDPCYAGSSVSTARLKANAFHSRAFHVRLRVHSSLPFTHPLLKPNRPQHTTPTATRQFGKLSSPTLSFLLPTPISCSQTSPKPPSHTSSNPSLPELRFALRLVSRTIFAHIAYSSR